MPRTLVAVAVGRTLRGLSAVPRARREGTYTGRPCPPARRSTAATAPARFADVVGQEHVVRTLSNAVEQGKVHHAYLFVGSRGTGKTSMAKILAACLNCEQRADDRAVRRLRVVRVDRRARPRST